MTAVGTPLVCNTVPTFCRHNRFVAECPICSKGTVLDPNRAAPKRRSTSSGARGSSKPAAAIAHSSRGPFVSAGPYDGAEIRLERVRVARWVMRPNRGWELQQAPVMLPPKRFSEALAAAARKGVLGQPEGALASGGPGE